MILNVLKKKFNKNYLSSLGNFTIKQNDERRIPTKIITLAQKINEANRKIADPRYFINL